MAIVRDHRHFCFPTDTFRGVIPDRFNALRFGDFSKFSITGVDSKDVLPEAHLVARYKTHQSNKAFALTAAQTRVSLSVCVFRVSNGFFAGYSIPHNLR